MFITAKAKKKRKKKEKEEKNVESLENNPGKLKESKQNILKYKIY